MLRKMVLCGAVFFASMVSVNAEEFTLKDSPKPAMVILSQTDDGGWAQALDEARMKMEADLGVKIPVVENVPENATAIRPTVELLIDRGYNVIIGSAFGYSDTLLELSKEYSDVAFLNPAGTTNSANLQSFYGRTYESQYLCGMIAGGLTESNKLGYVAANPFGLVNWTVNAYLMGARQVNPDATLAVVFTGAWNDPIKERNAAEALIEQGIDVIGQHVDTSTPQIVAEEHGIYSTGHHRDMSEFSKATQCSSVWVWDRYLGPEIQEIAAGHWEPNPYGAFLSIKEGGTDISCCGDAVSDELRERVMAEREAILEGKQIFTGPITDKDGVLRAAEGEVIGDGELWSMDWFVPGVISQ